MGDSLANTAWIKAPATGLVMDALEAAAPGGSRFVGGCVRNSLLGAPVDDVDIATTLTPEQVIAALAAARLKSIPTGVEYGTVTAIAKGQAFEITTLRRDVETDGRRAVVAFTDDWAEDAQRRDFRFNALYADRAGTVFDPTGGGLDDVRDGRVAFVGDAETRIREDYLRILRFFRFHAWYGRGEPDAEGLAACAAFKAGLAGLSAERVSKELLKLLAAPDPRPAVTLMAQTGVLSEILPRASNRGRFEALVEIERDQMWQADPVLRLAALLPDPAAGSTTARALRLSNAQHDRLVGALVQDDDIVSWMSPRAARRAVYEIGAEPFADRVKLAWASSTRTAAAPQWLALLALGATWSRPAPLITGEDAVAAGAPRGPLVGQVLREVERWWIDHDFPRDRDAAIEQLKAAVQGMAR